MYSAVTTARIDFLALLHMTCVTMNTDYITQFVIYKLSYNNFSLTRRIPVSEQVMNWY